MKQIQSTKIYKMYLKVYKNVLHYYFNDRLTTPGYLRIFVICDQLVGKYLTTSMILNFISIMTRTQLLMWEKYKMKF